MSFAESVTRAKCTTAAEQLQQVIGWLERDEPFLRMSCNDGEFVCMFQLRPATDKNNCGHHYFTDLADKLLDIFVDLRTVVYTRGDHIQIASYWQMQGSPGFDNLDPNAREFVKFITDQELIDKVNWVDSDALIRLDIMEQGLPMQILSVIREHSKDRPVVLVGNPRIADARHCINAHHVDIPRYDCWLATGRTMALCRKYAEQGATFVWCCGLAKPWIWELFNNYPKTSHFDAGHLFDGAFGEYNRAWLRRQTGPESEQWCMYKERFIPFVLGAIP